MNMVSKIVKKNDSTKYVLDLVIKWEDLNKLWNETKTVKGFKTWLRYVVNYDKYAPLANFATRIINEYHIPYKEIKPLYKEEKK